MDPQTYDWTCSVCTFTWTIQSTGIDPNLTRPAAGELIGYPNCVNASVGLAMTQCLIDAYAHYGLDAIESWVSFDQAYAICREHTGGISPSAMYHWMAIRGVTGDALWVANSAEGYCGVYDVLSRAQFNALGPVKLLALYQ